MLLLIFIALTTATHFHYEGKVEGHDVSIHGAITKQDIEMNIEVNPYMNITCYHSRDLRKFPCYKWIDLDVDHEPCLKMLKGHVSHLQIWFDNDEFKVSLKHYLWLTESAKAVTHGEPDICRH